MTALTDPQDIELRKALVEIGMAAPRLTLALQQPTPLIAILAWLDVITEQTERIKRLDLSFEVTATTAVRMKGEIPGSVVIYDLDELRIPDTIGDLT